MIKRYKCVKVHRKNNKRWSIIASGNFKIEYPKDKIVNAPGIGVMCFTTEIQAKTFLRNNWHLPNPRTFTTKIIEVTPLCKATRVPFWKTGGVAGEIREYIRLFSKYKSYEKLPRKTDIFIYPNKLFTGTVCYSKVKVLT